MTDFEIVHRLIEIFDYKAEYQAATSCLLPRDMFVLERIAVNPGTPTLTLSRKYHIPPATLIAVLDRLESQELILRERSTTDKRMVHVNLTAKGQLKVGQHMEEDSTFTKNLFAGLPPDEQQQIKQLLGKLLSSVEVSTLFN